MAQSLAWTLAESWRPRGRAAPGRREAPTGAGVDNASRPAAPVDGAALADIDERALVDACLAGRAGAFDVIVERHRRAVYQLCYRFVGNHEDASDLLQDVFLRAYRGLHRFRRESSLATWLYRIGVNVCLNRVAVKTPATEPIDERQPIDT